MVDRVLFSQEIVSLAYQARVLKKASPTRGILTADKLIWITNEKKYVLALEDIVGASSLPETSSYQMACFVVHAYPLIQKGKFFGKPKRVLREYYFACPDIEVRSQWVKAINNALVERTQTKKPRHLHILLNPASGQQKARRIFQKVRPMWEKSQIQLTVTETTSAGQAKKIIQTLPLEKIDGLVIIGGDGTLYEAINGLMSRPDWESAILTPIGLISAGTGNGLCKTLLDLAGEPYDPVSAAFLIAKGKTRPLDLAIAQQHHRRYYSALSLSWGFISDVDLESDKLRFLGSFKNTIYALIRILSLRTYKGRLSFSPVSDWTPATHGQCKSLAQCPICGDRLSPGLPLESVSHFTHVIEDEFVLFWAMNAIWAAHDIKATPHAHLSDGAMDLLVVRRGISKWQLLLAFLRSATGEHISLPYVEYYKVRSFCLEPLTSRGTLAIDGEQVDYLPIQLQVFQGLARVFGR